MARMILDSMNWSFSIQFQKRSTLEFVYSYLSLRKDLMSRQTLLLISWYLCSSLSCSIFQLTESRICLFFSFREISSLSSSRICLFWVQSFFLSLVLNKKYITFSSWQRSALSSFLSNKFYLTLINCYLCSMFLILFWSLRYSFTTVVKMAKDVMEQFFQTSSRAQLVFSSERFAVILVIFLRFIEPYLSSSDSSTDSGFKMQESDAVSKVIFF